MNEISQSGIRWRGLTLVGLFATALTTTATPGCKTYRGCEETRTCPPLGGAAGEDPGDGKSAASGGAASGGAGDQESSGGITSSGGANTGGKDHLGGAGPSGSTGGQTGSGAAASSGGAATGGASTQDPSACSDDADCPISGDCRISFEDKDGDGYGTSTVTAGRCDGSIPQGFSSVDTDCCDDGGELEVAALIHPGQEEYFSAEANICGIDWDYDCSGETDFQGSPTKDSGCTSSNGGSCSTSPDCQKQQAPLSLADCGSSVAIQSCFCGPSACQATNSAGRNILCH